MVKTGSESSPEVGRLHEAQEVDRKVFAILEEHYHAARKHMPPEAALGTAYTAANNYLTALKQRGGLTATFKGRSETAEQVVDTLSHLRGRMQ